MYFTSRIGLAASLVYQFAFVVPSWSRLVAKPLAATGVSAWGLAAVLVGFGGLYNLHNYCTAELFKTEGAVAVNLANACRWATNPCSSLFPDEVCKHLSRACFPLFVGGVWCVCVCVFVCVCVCMCACVYVSVSYAWARVRSCACGNSDVCMCPYVCVSESLVLDLVACMWCNRRGDGRFWKPSPLLQVSGCVPASAPLSSRASSHSPSLLPK
jgi:hypothetical protein